MDYSRSDRISELIKKETSNIIVNDLKDPRITGIITITKVEISKDLRHAKLYISIFNNENKAETLEIIKKASGFIKKEMNKRIKLRSIPELTFILDESIEHGVYISKLLKEVKNDNGEKK